MLNKSFKMSAAAIANGKDSNGNFYGGNGFSNNIEPESIGIKAWKPSEGRNLIDIIPFNADKNNPLVVAGKVSEGDVLYSIDYYTHRDVGPGHSNITCLTQYGKDCPLCRENQRLYKMGEQYKDAASKIRAKRRVVYLVHDLLHDTYGYWDTAWNQVEEPLTKEAAFAVNEETGEIINVFDWHDGMSVELQGTKDSYSGHEFIKPERFRFVKRQPLSDAVLEHSVDLSTTIKFTSPEDMEKLLSGKAVEVKNSAPVAEAPKTETVEKTQPTVTQSLAQQAVAEPAPAVETPAVQSDKACPCGYTWGDADHHPECSSCQVWEKCISG